MVIVVFILAAVLRLLNLGTNPGWDGDEGYNYNIALNLMRGHHQMFALDFVFVQHPPLFFLLAAGLFHMFGPSMFILRLLAALCSLATLLLLPSLAREVDVLRPPRPARLSPSLPPRPLRGSQGVLRPPRPLRGSLGGCLPPDPRQTTTVEATLVGLTTAALPIGARLAYSPGAPASSRQEAATEALAIADASPTTTCRRAAIASGGAPGEYDEGRQDAGAPSGYRRIALLAMLAYAVTPLVVLQTRFAYTYNALALWTVLAVVAVLRYRRTGTTGALLLSGVAVTLALTTDQEGIYLLPVLLLGLRGASLARRCAACALALAGPALYVGAMALTDRAALAFDITHTAGRVAGGSALFQAEALLYYLADLLRFNPAIPLGLAGLALVPYRPARRLLLGLLAAMLVVILKVRDPNPLFRTAEPLLPFVCLGLGALGHAMWTRLEAIAPTSRGRRPQEPARRRTLIINARGQSRGVLLAAILVAVAVVSATAYDLHAAATTFPTAIEGLLPRSPGDATAMARWLNARTRPSDVVIAMPQVSWMVHARTAELLQAVAYGGQASAFYPAGIIRRRWRYDVTLGKEGARFLVVDNFTRLWIAENANERALVGQAERAWTRVYRRGEYTIYENPAHVR